VKQSLQAALILSTAASAFAQGTCDRACLNKLVDSYLAAVVAHDPARVSIAPDAKFVENTKPMKPGEGLWKTASEAPTTFRIYVPDPVAGQIGFIGMMKEDGKPIELALRLKIRNGRIAEMEHLIARFNGPGSERSLANLQTPRPGLLAPVPTAERVPREQMLKIGLSYYDALVNGDGDAAPFADDCLRHENGMQTTGNPPPRTPGMGTMQAMGCHDQMFTKTFSYIKRIEPRRVETADVETGLVFGLSQFRHPMTEKSFKIVGVPGVEKIDLNIMPFDFPSAHIFKVSGGKLHEIEALGVSMPYNSPTGWEQ
jgi:hypothetical protein